MDITPELTVSSIVAFVVYPFAVFVLALRISNHNARSVGFITGLVATGLIGGVLAVAFLSTHRLSKYTSPDVVAGLVFTMAVAATGALVGAMFDRWIRPNQIPIHHQRADSTKDASTRSRNRA